MEIKELNNKEEWEGFLAQCGEKTFLQSWNWGEFNIKMGSQIWRFGAYNGSKLLAVALVIKVSARRGTFLFIPHGPIVLDSLVAEDRKEILELLLVQLSSIAKRERASFIRVSPLFSDSEENKDIFSDLGFRQAPMHASAYEATWKLDIYPAEDELLRNMRKTTRYLVKKVAENPDVSIEISSDPKNIETYQQLNKKVAKRQRFVPFSDSFVKNEFEVFAKDREVIFLFGRYSPPTNFEIKNGVKKINPELNSKLVGGKSEVAAGAIVIFWQGIGFYHQAASLGKFAKLSIPYLLQWEAIREAKKRGCLIYDFWGFTDPVKFPKHPWAGPTLFKMGFGGYSRSYMKTQDFVISKKYWINYIIEKLRKSRRGL